MKMLLALAAVAFFGVQDSTVYSPGNGVSLPQVTRQIKADTRTKRRRTVSRARSSSTWSSWPTAPWAT